MKHFLTLISLVTAAHMFAATYFASPSGKGDGQTYASATSFSNGVSKLKNPGDTLYLLGGTYEFSDKFSINKKGSSAKYIVIAGYPGEEAVLDFHKVAYGTRGVTIHSEAVYVHLKDFAIAYSGKNNLYCEGSYCLFENLDIYGSADTGCQMKKGGNNIIKNVDSHDNFDYETMSGTTANFGGNADGFADKQHSGAGNTYIGCRAWNNSDDGWDFFQRVSATPTTIEYCICYANGAPYYDMRQHPRYQTDKAWFDSKVGTQMIDRYGNTITITLDRYPCQGNGNGFKMGGEKTQHIVTLHHCLTVGNYARGYDQNNNDGTMWLYNCSAYDNVYNYGFTTACGTNTLRNCISYRSRNADAYASKTTTANDHNTWNSGYSCAKSDFVSLDTTLILTPRQADGTLPVTAFMHLQASSSLIDRGADVGYAYAGTAPDLGCYEYGLDTIIPGPTPEPEDTTGIRIAYISTPDAIADEALLAWLKKDTALYIKVLDAAQEQDLSSFRMVILSPVPKSTVAGAVALKDNTLPFLCLKPFMGKNTVWNWCTPANTSYDAINVQRPTHAIFTKPYAITGLEDVSIYNRVSTNGVAVMSDWTIPVQSLATTDSKDAVVERQGTRRVIMMGLSEYSMADISENGKQLVRNAIYYLLDEYPATTIRPTQTSTPTAHKVLRNGQLLILREGQVYSMQGQLLTR